MKLTQRPTKITHSRVPGFARAAVLIAALGLPLAHAEAQCNVSRTGTPDFDQRRLGLPNGGNFYCAPAAIANFLALLANSGYPDAFNVQTGGHNWQLPGWFGMVSVRIGQLGLMMSTDPLVGTNLVNARTGAQQWLDQNAPGKFVVMGYYAYQDYFPHPYHLYHVQKQGGYVAPFWGRYQPDGNGLTRAGGHMISMTVMENACGASPKIMYRDPDDAGVIANDIQSWFTSQAAFLVPTPGLYRPNAGSPHTPGVLFRFSNSQNQMLDGYMVIMPLKYTTPSQTPGVIQAHNPVQPVGLLLPAWQKLQAPTTAPFEGLANDPRLLAYYVSTAPTRTEPARVWRLDAIDGTASIVHSPDTAGPLATGRFGELYIADGRTITSMKAATGTPAVIASRLLPATVDALVYDDATDKIFALNIAQKQIMRVDRYLAGPVQVLSLPSEMPLGIDASFAVGFGGGVFVAAGDVNGIYELEESAAAPAYNLKGLIVSSTGATLMSLQVDDRNNLFYAEEGIIHEVEKDAAGTWRPAANSTLGGMPANRIFALVRGRTNFDFATMNDPAFHEIGPANAPGIPDCYANCDGSMNAPILNIDDFTCYINAFASAQTLSHEAQILHYANCDGSTATPVLNIDDFTCFINAFALGCP